MFFTKEDLDIRDVAGPELALYYPDRGILHASEFFRAQLRFEPRDDEAGWFRRFELSTHSFSTVLSSSDEGLRMFVPQYQYSLFIPWAEADCSAERWGDRVIVRVTTREVPSPAVVVDLPHAAAHYLFGKVIPGIASPETLPRARVNRVQAALSLLLALVTLAAVLGLWSAL